MRLDSELMSLLPDSQFSEVSHARNFMGEVPPSPSFTGEEQRYPAPGQARRERRVDLRIQDRVTGSRKQAAGTGKRPTRLSTRTALDQSAEPTYTHVTTEVACGHLPRIAATLNKC